MNLFGRIIFGAAVALLSCSELFGQTSSPSPEKKPGITSDCVPYHRLTIDDFPINDREHPKEGIWIETCLQYDFKYLVSYDVRFYVHVTEWNVRSGLNKAHSSRRSAFHQMADALPGVQTYLDITEVHARKLASLQPTDLPVGNGDTAEAAILNLQLKIRQLYEKTMVDIQDEGQKFGAETERGANKKKLREWQAKLKRRLKEVGITSAD